MFFKKTKIQEPPNAIPYFWVLPKMLEEENNQPTSPPPLPFRRKKRKINNMINVHNVQYVTILTPTSSSGGVFFKQFSHSGNWV